MRTRRVGSPAIVSSAEALRKHAATLARSEKGSYTLESALIYPTILIAVVSLIFVSLFVYKQASLYETASETAERAAFTWDNSGKDFESGYVLPNRHDGLYWRTGSDGLSGMFSFGGGFGLQKVELPAGSNGNVSSAAAAPAGKLARAAGELPGLFEGELTYRHGIIDREVTVRLEQTGTLPFMAKTWMHSRMDAEVRSVVTEPAELIRSIDFVRTFVVRVKDLLTKSKAEEIVPAEALQEEQRRLVFARAAEAAEYVRGITGGKVTEVKAPSGRRILDALDADGLMHEVKLGYTSKSKDIESQIVKDVELMRQSTEVKGAVWHFFRKEKDGKIGPSKPLRQYLEQQGIIVVIHQ
ncbi:TadE/TadG family type IV pilus assembly protein [Paenibacillus ginsengarvi]|uniref:Pilus assembly protein n=1 Tax=Paenibacillus ginsengarvi TaxID=400777 RepID=A0A3B0CHQ7_9BACL|nr:hypothetical protein [Paenibacillus ginsengarvi]RKN84154.1 hypothetical protein D7M11_14175 [Paenibacillus ginsengarvi]